eukprot:GHVP01005295.1.p1 GENE.GHVP01005295.1~~GHVP01005295.1.p1  ORF type:complete len:306 (+),score=42.02 GHVP01005295.1:1625-2542(+)
MFIDRFGFSVDIPGEYNKTLINTQKSSKQEKRRIKKWNIMLNRTRPMSHPKMIPRIKKGVPDAVRPRFWEFFLLKKDEIPFSNLEVDITQILLDINRTFQNHQYISTDDGRQELLYVLENYALHDPDVGYCQGMSSIAAVFVIYYGYQKASHFFLSFMYTIRENFLPGFPALKTSILNISELLSSILPTVDRKFKEYDIDPSLYLPKWILTYFTFLPFSLAMRIWDLSMFNGHKMSISVSLALLDVSKSHIEGFSSEALYIYLCNIDEKLFPNVEHGYTKEHKALEDFIIRKAIFYHEKYIKAQD